MGVEGRCKVILELEGAFQMEVMKMRSGVLA